MSRLAHPDSFEHTFRHNVTSLPLVNKGLNLGKTFVKSSRMEEHVPTRDEALELLKQFKRSFNSCKSKPSDPQITQDLEVQIEQIFTFSRICRNEVGHPQMVPNLDRGVLLANFGQFVKYIQRIYALIEYFRATPVEV